MAFGARKSKWEILGEELRDQRADYTREVAEGRLFNRELLIRLEKTYAGLGTTMSLMGDEIIAMRGEIIAMRGEIHELKGAVDAQTHAIMKLLDRFEDPGGRPPV